MNEFFKFWTIMQQYFRYTDNSNIVAKEIHNNYIYTKYKGKVIPVKITKDKQGHMSLLVNDVFLFPIDTYPKIVIKSFYKNDRSYYEGSYLIENIKNINSDVLILSRGDIKPHTKGFINIVRWAAPDSGPAYNSDETNKAYVTVGNVTNINTKIGLAFYKAKFFIEKNKTILIIALIIYVLLIISKTQS